MSVLWYGAISIVAYIYFIDRYKHDRGRGRNGVKTTASTQVGNIANYVIHASTKCFVRYFIMTGRMIKVLFDLLVILMLFYFSS